MRGSVPPKPQVPTVNLSHRSMHQDAPATVSLGGMAVRAREVTAA